MIESADYFVRLMKMPYGVHGCVSENDDGTYSVYINERDTYERQLRAYRHEKKHIQRNDFSRSDVREIEDL